MPRILPAAAFLCALLLCVLLLLLAPPIADAKQFGVGDYGCVCSIGSTRGIAADADDGPLLPPVTAQSMQSAAEVTAGIPSLSQLQQGALDEVLQAGGSSSGLDWDRAQTILPQLLGGAITCTPSCSQIDTTQFSKQGDFVTLSVGADGQLCAVHSEGHLVECIGANDNTQCDSPPGLQALELSSGSEVTCALQLNYTLTCWGGLDSQGELDPPPQFVDGSFVVESFQMRLTGGCGIAHRPGQAWDEVSENVLMCWGIVGPQLPPPNTPTHYPLSIPTLQPGVRWVQVALNSDDVNSQFWGVALDSEGKVWNLPSDGSNPSVVVESEYQPMVRVAMGNHVVCGVTAVSAELLCWLAPMSTAFDSLQLSEYNQIHVLPAPPASLQLKSYEMGDLECYGLTCAAVATNVFNSLQLWGSLSDSYDPAPPDTIAGNDTYQPPLGGVSRVELGHDFGCVLMTDARVSCFSTDATLPFDTSSTATQVWIRDWYVNGNPFTTCSPYGLPLLPLYQFAVIAIPKGLMQGVETYLSFLSPLASVTCSYDGSAIPANMDSVPSGGFFFGTLGSNSWNPDFTSVNNTAATLRTLSAGAGYSCGLNIHSEVRCLPFENNPGQGISLEAPNLDPRPQRTYASVQAGQGFYCLLRFDASLWCNNATVVGISADVGLSTWGLPQSRAGEENTPFLQLGAGDTHLCAVLALNHTVRCWGMYSNYTLDSHQNILSSSLTPVGPLPPDVASASFDSVFGGTSVSCGVLSGSLAVRCWGRCKHGMCDVPVPPKFARTDKGAPTAYAFRSISVGSVKVCGITADGSRTLVCWGSGSRTLSDLSSPVGPPHLGLVPLPSSVALMAPLNAYAVGADIRVCPRGTQSLTGGATTSLCNGGCQPGAAAAQSPLEATLAAGMAKVMTDSCAGSVCAAGSWCPSATLAQIPCAAGRFGSSVGLQTAACSDLCVPGFFCPTGTPQATTNPCPAGRFGHETGLFHANCSGASAAGYYTLPGSRTPTAFACPSAAFVCPPASAVAPLAVPPGHFSVSSLSPTQRNASGLQPGQGMTGTLPCPPGQACMNGVAQACAPGTVAPVVATPTCDPCPSGKFQSAPAQLVCALCQPGFFSNRTGQAKCDACPSGSASAGEGSLACRSCSPGFYSLGGVPRCAPCPPHSYAPTQGALTCAPCDAPNIVQHNGTECSLPRSCDAGSYSVLFAADSHWPVGSCRPCAPGSASGPGAVGACEQCPPDSYSLGEGSSMCRACPDDGFVCGGDTAGLPQVMAEYWGWVLPDGLTVAAAVCPQGFCTGGNLLLAPLLLSPSTWNASGIPIALQLRLSSQRPCSAHRDSSVSNVLCGSCVKGYVEWRNGCVSCPSVRGDLLFALVLASFVFMLVMHVLSQRSNADFKILLVFVQSALLQLGSFVEWLGWMAFLNFDVTRAAGDTCIAPLTPMQHVAASLAMPVLLFVQLLLIIAMHHAWGLFRQRQMRLMPERLGHQQHPSGERAVQQQPHPLSPNPSPSIVVSVASAKSRSAPTRYLLADVSSLSRSVPAHDDIDDDVSAVSYELLQHDQLAQADDAIFDLAHASDASDPSLKIAPAAVASPSPVLSPFLSVSVSSTLSGRVSAAFPLSSDAFSRTLLSLFLLSFQHIASASMEFLNCVSVDGVSVVFSSPALLCDATHRRVAPVVWTLLAITVVVGPLAMLMVLWRHRHHLHTHTPEALRFCARYGVLYDSYRPSLWFWQLWILLRQLSLVALAIFFHADHSNRYLAFSLVNSIGLLMHVQLQPFREARTNVGGSIALQLLLCISIVLLAHPPPSTDSLQIALSMLLLPFTIVWSVVCIYAKVRAQSGSKSQSDEHDRDTAKDQSPSLSSDQ